LPEGSALVEWSVYFPFRPRARTLQERWGPDRYAACVLPRQGEPACVDLGEVAPINTAVSRLLQALSRSASPHIKDLARELDAQVMAPVRTLLGETRWVFLSPDGALNLVPFAALVDESGRYLVKTHAFTYLTSGRDLLRLREAPPPPREVATVMAAPNFDASGAAGRAGDAKADGKRGALSREWAGIKFDELAGTANEARAVQGTLGSARVLLGGEANERAFKALHGPSVLHIATHGFFLPDQPESRAAPRAFAGLLDGIRRMPAPGEDLLLRSGLALAGANQLQTGADDGVLTALEVSGTDLYGTRLVVLSACETGVGNVTVGDGVYGLRRALVLAGARTQ